MGCARVGCWYAVVMSSTVLLTGYAFNAARGVAVDVVTIVPLPPTREGVSGVGVLDDGVLLPDAVTVAVGSDGSFAVGVVPSEEVATGDDNTPCRYRLTFGDGASVVVTVPASSDPVPLGGLLNG